MRFWIVCGLATLAGGRCLADGGLLGRSLFLGRSGGGDRGLLGGFDLCRSLRSGSLCRGLLGRRRALARGGLGGRLGLDSCFGLGLGRRLLDLGCRLCGCLGRGGLGRGGLGRGGLGSRRLRSCSLLGCRCLLGGRGCLLGSGLCRSLGGRFGLSDLGLYLGSSLGLGGLLGSGGRALARGRCLGNRCFSRGGLDRRNLLSGRLTGRGLLSCRLCSGLVLDLCLGEQPQPSP